MTHNISLVSCQQISSNKHFHHNKFFFFLTKTNRCVVNLRKKCSYVDGDEPKKNLSVGIPYPFSFDLSPTPIQSNNVFFLFFFHFFSVNLIRINFQSWQKKIFSLNKRFWINGSCFHCCRSFESLKEIRSKDKKQSNQIFPFLSIFSLIWSRKFQFESYRSDLEYEHKYVMEIFIFVESKMISSKFDYLFSLWENSFSKH